MVSSTVSVRKGGYSVASETKNTGSTVSVKKGGYSVAQEKGTTTKTTSPPLSVSSGPKSVAEQDRIIATQKAAEQAEINKKVASLQAINANASATQAAKIKAQNDAIKANQAKIDAQIAAAKNAQVVYPTIKVGSSIKSTAQTTPIKQVTTTPQKTNTSKISSSQLGKITEVKTYTPSVVNPSYQKTTSTPTNTVTPIQKASVPSSNKNFGIALAASNKPMITSQTLKGSYQKVGYVPSVVNPTNATTYYNQQINKQLQNSQTGKLLSSTRIYPSTVTPTQEQGTLDKINSRMAGFFEPIYQRIDNNNVISSYDKTFKNTIGRAIYPGSALSFINTPKQAASTVVGVGEGIVTFIPSTLSLGKGLLTNPVGTIKETAKGTYDLAKTNPGRLTGNVIGSTIAGGAIGKVAKSSVNTAKEFPYRIVKNTEPSNFLLRIPDVNAIETSKPVPSPATRLTTPDVIEFKAFSGKVTKGKADAFFKLTEAEGRKVIGATDTVIENIRTKYGSFVELTPIKEKTVLPKNIIDKQIGTTEYNLIGENAVSKKAFEFKFPYRIERFKEIEPAYFQNMNIPKRLQIPEITYDMEVKPTKPLGPDRQIPIKGSKERTGISPEEQAYAKVFSTAVRDTEAYYKAAEVVSKRVLGEMGIKNAGEIEYKIVGKGNPSYTYLSDAEIMGVTSAPIIKGKKYTIIEDGKKIKLMGTENIPTQIIIPDSSLIDDSIVRNFGHEMGHATQKGGSSFTNPVSGINSKITRIYAESTAERFGKRFAKKFEDIYGIEADYGKTSIGKLPIYKQIQYYKKSNFDPYVVGYSITDSKIPLFGTKPQFKTGKIQGIKVDYQTPTRMYDEGLINIDSAKKTPVKEKYVSPIETFKSTVEQIKKDYGVYYNTPELKTHPIIKQEKTMLKYTEPIKQSNFNEEIKRLYANVPKSTINMSGFGYATNPFKTPNINNPFKPSSGGGGSGSFISGGKRPGLIDGGGGIFGWNKDSGMGSGITPGYPTQPFKGKTPKYIPKPSPIPIYGSIPQPEPSGGSGGAPAPSDNGPRPGVIPYIYDNPINPPVPDPYPYGSSSLPPLPPKGSKGYPSFNTSMFSYPMPERKREKNTVATKKNKNKRFQWFIQNPVADVFDEKEFRKQQNAKW